MTKLAQIAREFFDYKNGKLFWNQDRGYKIKAGDRAGWVDQDGYIRITINGKKYFEHRLIYALHNPDWDEKVQIDHINGKKGDNRIDNLRLVTHQENHFNRTTAKGYNWHKPRKKWIARIVVGGKLKYLGLFVKEEDARNAYLKAKKELHIIENRK